MNINKMTNRILQGLLVILLISPLLYSNAFADEVLEIECPALKKALVQLVGNEELIISDLEALTDKVDLSYCNIKSVKGLEHLKNVDELILSYNNITDITPILGLSNLESLYLDNNWIKQLPDSSSLTSLEHLDISHNEIESIPTSLLNMPSLKRLYMSDLQLEDSPDFSQLPSALDWLDISGNKFDDFSFLDGQNLELLMMNNCGLDELPNLFMMDRLRYLYFTDNNISELPEYLGNLPLERLDFSHNDIWAMPQSFGRLAELKQLIFTGNYFRSMPQVITKIKGLEVLMCGQNIINDVPSDIGELENIKRASFVGNEFVTLEKFRNLYIPYSYQISFDQNYLDLDDEINLEVLKRYHNSGGVQKTDALKANVISTQTDNLIIDLELDISSMGDDIKFKEIKLFEIVNDTLDKKQCNVIEREGSVSRIVSNNQAVGMHDYLLCMVLEKTSHPKREIKYTATLEQVALEEKVTPTPSVTSTNTIEVTPTVTPAVSDNNQKSSNRNYLLYILLFGVIMIVISYLLQKRSSKKRRKHKRR